MNHPNVIGRFSEIGILDRLYKSRKSEFLAIYGRRRVGKSYLVSEVFKGKNAFPLSAHTLKMETETRNPTGDFS